MSLFDHLGVLLAMIYGGIHALIMSNFKWYIWLPSMMIVFLICYWLEDWAYNKKTIQVESSSELLLNMYHQGYIQ